MTNVLLEKKGNIAVATINRPKALNALNSQVLEDLNELVELVKADEEIRALVLTGCGEKAFVAGADIGEMSTLTKAGGEAFEINHGLVTVFYSTIFNSQQSCVLLLNFL